MAKAKPIVICSQLWCFMITETKEICKCEYCRKLYQLKRFAEGHEEVCVAVCTLHLNLHSKWFNMILSGQKKEEYREMKPFWHKRFLAGKEFSTITFSNGYGKNRRQFVIECKGVQSCLGIVEWGAPEGVCVYILKLGQILSRNNYC